MAGADRGNMRCFEALGSGSLLLSDDDNYPEGMRDGETIVTYNSPEDAVRQIRTLLVASEERINIAQRAMKWYRRAIQRKSSGSASRHSWL
jgi:spore maturation protein CgeB